VPPWSLGTQSLDWGAASTRATCGVEPVEGGVWSKCGVYSSTIDSRPHSAARQPACADHLLLPQRRAGTVKNATLSPLNQSSAAADRPRRSFHAQRRLTQTDPIVIHGSGLRRANRSRAATNHPIPPKACLPWTAPPLLYVRTAMGTGRVHFQGVPKAARHGSRKQLAFPRRELTPLGRLVFRPIAAATILLQQLQPRAFSGGRSCGETGFAQRPRCLGRTPYAQSRDPNTHDARIGRTPEA